MLNLPQKSIQNTDTRPRRNSKLDAIRDNPIRWVLGRRSGPAQGVWGTRGTPSNIFKLPTNTTLCFLQQSL
ncbi:MAG: hypothetical protein AAGI69_18925 [Cyanobacteria bacterium P01_H01_bin.21]